MWGSYFRGSPAFSSSSSSSLLLPSSSSCSCSSSSTHHHSSSTAHTHHHSIIITHDSSLIIYYSSVTTRTLTQSHAHTYIQHPPEDSKHPLQSALLDAARASGRPSTLPQCGLPSSLATSSSSTRSLCSRIRTRIGNASQALGGLLLVRIQRGAVSEQDPSSWPGLCCGLDSPRACWRSSTSGHHADGR